MYYFCRKTNSGRTQAFCLLLKLIFSVPALAVLYAANLYAQDTDASVPVLESVVITASPFENRSELDSAQPVSILKGDDLRRKREASIGDTLSKELGVTSSAFGVGAGRPIIRGLDGPRIRVLEGGIGTLDISSLSPDHMVTTESLAAQRIEILRGPASLLFGSGASGGVVNVVTERIPERIFKAPQGDVELRTHSALKERTGSFNATGSTQQFSWHVDGFKRRTQDYSIPGRSNLADPLSAEGVLPNSAIDSGGLAAGGSYIGERGFLGASLSRLQSDYGVPGAEGATIALKQTRTDIAGELDDPYPGFSKLKVRMGYNQYRHNEIESSGDIAARFKNKGLESRFELSHLPIRGWQGVAGLQTQARNFSALGDEIIVPATKTHANGIFLVEERVWDSWRLELGGRMERETHKPEGDNPMRDFNLYSYSAGTVWRFFEGHSLGVSATRAQRAPAAEELYVYGAHVATGTFETGNNELSRETSNNFDVTLRKTHGRVKWKINVYVNRINNFIYQQSADVDGNGVADRVDHTGMLDPNGKFLVQNFAQTQARFRGIEAEILFGLIPDKLDLRLFTDLNRATLADGSNVPRMPPQRAGIEATYQQGPWQAWASLLRAAGQNRVAPLETSTSGYTLLDAELSYRIKTPISYTLFLQVKNLLDRDIRLHTSYLKDVAPQPGRAMIVGVRGEF